MRAHTQLYHVSSGKSSVICKSIYMYAAVATEGEGRPETQIRVRECRKTWVGDGMEDTAERGTATWVYQ
eukprot:9116527-Pyramimonas_sp.AAC.1